MAIRTHDIPRESSRLHRQAMDLAEEGVLARRRGEPCAELFSQAFDCEYAAAQKVRVEPSRSIMLRSAAYLAMDAERPRDAERAIGLALSQSPPESIANELRDLLDDVNLHRHLELRGMRLDDDEIRFAIAGPEVGGGLADADAFFRRTGHMKSLVMRSGARKAGKAFGEPSPFETFVGAPKKAASLAVAFRIAWPKNQVDFLRGVTPPQVAREVVECFELLDRGKDAELRARIDDKDYHSNFIALARHIVPDGKDVRVVSLTHVRAGFPSLELPVKRTRSTIKVDPQLPSSPPEQRVEGILNFADAENESRPVVKVAGTKLTVEASMMADVVRPLWGKRVRASFSMVGRKKLLIDIDEIDP